MRTMDENTPYSKEALQWLLEHSTAKKSLRDELKQKIDAALHNGDEEYLQNMFPILLDKHLKEENTDLNFALQQTMMMGDFDDDVEGTGKQMDHEKKEMKMKVERYEQKQANEMLKKLND